jgi:hypothetical protein
MIVEADVTISGLEATRSDGKRVERTTAVGLVKDISPFRES